MGLLRSSRAVLTDDDVAAALGRAVRLITPLLGMLADTDPLGLKARTHDDPAADRAPAGPAVLESALESMVDGAAWVINVAHAPGTRAWDGMDVRHRANWWVRRVGALNTLAVASPRSLGLLSTLLPVQPMLGFANQALVLCAVAREHGVTDPAVCVQLLAAVLCGRSLDRDLAERHLDPDGDVEEPRPSRNPITLIRTWWHLAAVLRGIGDELDRRPQPRRVFRRLSVLPGVGGVAAYLGEYGALRRAAKAATAYLGAYQQARPDAVGLPEVDGGHPEVDGGVEQSPVDLT
ncbi:hypothetical protein H7J07_08240 [Mycobacterium koreense]|uniref:hypothetical protein n=1 Tax=Mycolicibacillus koreensis TaxID=1069220 RepID=UPI000D6A73D7|nr:hypothetical protein [Mycolicibacillus koreensis]MCV7248207.1 hypothetical protein [Mycolicibacillus koreensis]BBY55144.1 hypothetical protein MKOR_23950 [Mycolicibacillus koreensis]